MKASSDSVEYNLPTAKYGTVGTLDDGRQYVKFVRELSFPITDVWSALTDPDRIADWFPGLNLEAWEGGTFEIWFSENCEGEAHVSGRVIEVSPPNLLEFGTQRWQLEPTENGCVLTFTDVLLFDERDKRDFSNSVLAGWHKYLDSLQRMLDGGSGDPRLDAEVDYSVLDTPGRV